ncbi:putative histidine kinase response regulator and transcription factor RR-A-type family [Dioscorea sansibarensis]
MFSIDFQLLHYYYWPSGLVPYSFDFTDKLFITRITMELGNQNPDAPSLKRKLRALIVDDCKFQQSILVGYLRGLGVESLVANNGEEALRIMLEGPMLDLIIMDKDMPEMNGIQAFFSLTCIQKTLAKISKKNQSLFSLF